VKHRILELIKSVDMQDAQSITCEQIVFEERVLLKCFSCQRYNVSWMCPPRIPTIDYRKIISECDNLILAYCKMPFIKEQLQTVRAKSTNAIHRTLLACEKLLWENNYPLSISFIGGSCKLCVSGCDQTACQQPSLARIPLEAAGVNVVKTAKNVDIDIKFPPREFMYRVGLIGW
jgi:predicted metal-binding protein